MDKNILTKALLNGAAGWLALAVFLSLTKDISFVQAFTAPHTIALSVAAGLGSYIGFMRKAKEEINA